MKKKQKIKAQMVLINMSQDTLAKILGVSKATLNKYIANPENMTIKFAKALCKEIHLDIGELI